MLFNSYIFVFMFLPITFFVYFLLNYKSYTNLSKIFLISASLFFYSYWNIKYLPILLFSMFVNYFIGLRLSKYNFSTALNKKLFLIFGIALNILLLGYFKYVDFFINNLNFVFNSQISLLHLALPLALSFVTFQQIAYITDCYRGGVQQHNFLNYGIFITFFPQLIAGPIVHHKEVIPQFASIKNKFLNYKNISIGLFIFSIGLFKKVAIADTFAVWATLGFDTAKSLSFFEAWATSLSYTFQLYFDFSGYCDMAIGSALLFNIKLPINFNSPYKSLNIQEFWRRWHITLGKFLTDYLYIPLGGSRISKFRTYINLMIVFLLSGFWHGAGWTFIFWGFLHGLAIVIHRVWMNLNFKMNKFIAWFITFNFVNFAWIFFRAKSWDDAIKVLKGMLDIQNIVFSDKFATLFNYLNPFYFIEDISYNKSKIIFDIHVLEMICVTLILTLLFKNSILLSFSNRNKIYYPIYCAFIFFVSVILISTSKYSEFIYFNF